MLGDEFNFYILTSDRDINADEEYPELRTGELKYDCWNRIGKAQVWYVKNGEFSLGLLYKICSDFEPVFITCFYRDYGRSVLLLKRIGMLKGCKILIAAMGVFSREAFENKMVKKAFFTSLLNNLGFFRKCTWSVSSNEEASDVYRVLGNKAKCILTEDIPRRVNDYNHVRRDEKLRILFISRIHPHKNLDYALTLLKYVTLYRKEEIIFDVYGPICDEGYWQQCLQITAELPQSVKFRYAGEVNPGDVPDIMNRYDLMLLPSKSENYCHVVFEALMSGCVPVISDRTPWTDRLRSYNAGYVCKIESISKDSDFVSSMLDYIGKSEEERMAMSLSAHKLACETYGSAFKDTGYRELFRQA